MTARILSAFGTTQADKAEEGAFFCSAFSVFLRLSTASVRTRLLKHIREGSTLNMQEIKSKNKKPPRIGAVFIYY